MIILVLRVAIFRVLAVALLVSAAAIPGIGTALAQTGDVTPKVFSGPLPLSRGTITAGSPEAVYLSKPDFCRIVTVEWGWDNCDGLEAMVITHVPGVDTTLVERPNSEGHVSFEDWKGADQAKVIHDIETDLAAGMKAQGEKIGQKIEFKGWRVYPTLDEGKNYLVYATDSIWNGEAITNIKATVFDRRGYVVFDIVPVASDATEADIRAMVEATIATYKPTADQGYAAFAPGDKVAATGALGVLAALVGVKLGKVGLIGLFAVALIALKKGAILVVLPFIWLYRKLRGRKDQGPSA